MTIQEVRLTEKEIADAIAGAACGKLGVEGEHRVEVKFSFRGGTGHGRVLPGQRHGRVLHGDPAQGRFRRAQRRRRAS